MEAVTAETEPTLPIRQIADPDKPYYKSMGAGTRYEWRGDAVVIGRFQTPWPTPAHRELLDIAIQHAGPEGVVLVLLATSSTITKANPLSYAIRASIMRQFLRERTSGLDEAPYCHVAPINDHPFDAQWVSNVHEQIRGHGLENPTLIWGHDSSRHVYEANGGTYACHTIKHIDDHASVLRQRVRPPYGEPQDNMFEFTRGMIYQTERMYPQTYPTVDVALVRELPQGGMALPPGSVDHRRRRLEVAMCRKPGEPEGMWRFPGGFVDPKDVNHEAAAMRELTEELGSHVVSNLMYLGSVRVNDWRYRRGPEGIMTTFFGMRHVNGDLEASDDISHATWIPLERVQEVVNPVHEELAKILLRKIGDFLT
jgi:bifunctional NMN adenylyltransferase/nudix hydrolase